MFCFWVILRLLKIALNTQTNGACYWEVIQCWADSTGFTVWVFGNY